MFDVIISGLQVGDKKTVRRVKGCMMVGVIYLGLNIFLTVFFVARFVAQVVGLV